MTINNMIMIIMMMDAMWGKVNCQLGPLNQQQVLTAAALGCNKHRHNHHHHPPRHRHHHAPTHT